MTNMRAMAVFQGGSGLPEDRFINVFHFTGGGVAASDMAAAAARVAEFYDSVPAGASTAVGGFLSPYIQRAFEVRVYDLDTPKPRVPTIGTYTLPASVNPSGMPEEVALCVSYTAAPPITKRRRGRIYIGPLNQSAAVFVPASTTDFSHPGEEFTNTCAFAAAFLAQDGTVDWVIRSSLPTENFVRIAAGYVDNAFDTQRRRGPDPTTRTPWSPIGV